MKLHFLGAARQVTGSCYYLETSQARIMIDCGMFQEHDLLQRNWASWPMNPAELDALILTHAHLDHTGRVPRLVAGGFRRTMHMTRPTVDLVTIVMADAGKIQEEDAKYKAKRHEREGRKGQFPEKPLFTREDVVTAMPLLRGHDYRKPVQVAPGITATFHDAGHILGSSMVELMVKDNGGTCRLLFSGDIGNVEKPFASDPAVFQHADYVVMESTYGGREHEEDGTVEDQLERVINDTFRRGGNVVIPTFAIERAQELMWHVGNLVRARRIDRPRAFLDSPMARDVTDVYEKYVDWCDEDVASAIKSGEAPLRFDGLKIVQSPAESMAINDVREPCLIMASSGMCEGGRIKHHLRQNLPRPESTVLFVGYQAQKTLGREIVDGAPEVRIHGRLWPVRAKIAEATGFSAHADHVGLMRWASHFQNKPRQVFLTHGEESAAMMLEAALKAERGWNVIVPHYGEAVELT